MKRKMKIWMYIAVAMTGVLAYTQRDWLMEQWEKMKGSSNDTTEA